MHHVHLLYQYLLPKSLCRSSSLRWPAHNRHSFWVGWILWRHHRREDNGYDPWNYRLQIIHLYRLIMQRNRQDVRFGLEHNLFAVLDQDLLLGYRLQHLLLLTSKQDQIERLNSFIRDVYFKGPSSELPVSNHRLIWRAIPVDHRLHHVSHCCDSRIVPWRGLTAHLDVPPK